MTDVRNIDGLRWLAEVQGSDAAKWALEEISRLQNSGPKAGVHRRDIDRIWHAQDGNCFYCHSPMTYGRDSRWWSHKGTGWTLDHFIPTAKGGTHTPSNIVLAHRWCNTAKADRLPTDSEIARFRATFGGDPESVK